MTEYIFEFHLNNGDIIEHAATKEEDNELLIFLKGVEKTWNSIVLEKPTADRHEAN